MKLDVAMAPRTAKSLFEEVPVYQRAKETRLVQISWVVDMPC